MTEKKKWFTTEEIGRWYGEESDKIDLTYAKREISLKKSIYKTEALKRRLWLSSQAAGELADKLEKRLEEWDDCGWDLTEFREVVRVLRGAEK